MDLNRIIRVSSRVVIKMKVLLLIVIACLPVVLLQWAYIRLTDQVKTPKHHKNSDYIDESFKFTFNEKRVKAISGESNNDMWRNS